MVTRLAIAVWLLTLLAHGATWGGLVIQSSGSAAHYGNSPWDRMARAASNQVATLTAANGTNRTLWVDALPPVSISNWAHTIDFSGLSRDGAFDLALITPRHGITAWHYGSPSGEIIFESADGQRTTNAVASSSNPISDIRLVTLVSNVPSFIHPFAAMPTNWWNSLSNSVWIGPGLTNPIASVYVRNNTKSLNLTQWTRTHVWTDNTYYYGYYVCDPTGATGWVVDSPLYAAETLDDGDSGGPMFLLIEGRAVFLGAIHFANRSGPCVSYPANFQAIQTAVSPSTLTVLDLTLYGL